MARCHDGPCDAAGILVKGEAHPAEFFALATECFFEKPRPLRHKHPELYDELKRYYQQDPAEWLAAHF